MPDPATCALAYDLFADVLSGLEADTIRTHVWEQTGIEATEEQVQDITDEWTALRRYIEKRGTQGAPRG